MLSEAWGWGFVAAPKFQFLAIFLTRFTAVINGAIKHRQQLRISLGSSSCYHHHDQHNFIALEINVLNLCSTLLSPRNQISCLCLPPWAPSLTWCCGLHSRFCSLDEQVKRSWAWFAIQISVIYLGTECTPCSGSQSCWIPSLPAWPVRTSKRYI